MVLNLFEFTSFRNEYDREPDLVENEEVVGVVPRDHVEGSTTLSSHLKLSMTSTIQKR